jgi:hypothetical protein
MKLRLPQSPTGPNVRLAFPIAVASACLLLALAACSGGDDDTPTGSASPTQTSRTTSTDGATGEDQTLEELLESYLAGVDGKITYRTTSENFGEHPNLIWTEYRLGGDARVDWRNVVENPADDPMITTIAIISDDGAYICTDSPGLKSCNAKTPEEAQTLIFWRPSVDEAPEAIAGGIDGMTVSDATKREIAGVQASCFTIEVPAGIGIIRPGQTAQESIQLCFSDVGALLVMSRTVDFDDEAFPTAKLEVTAQEIAEAEPGDFEPIASPLN